MQSGPKPITFAMSSKWNESRAYGGIQDQWSSLRPHDDQDDEADGLQDSEVTQPTDGSGCDDDVGGWLGSFGTDFRNMAACFKESTLPVLGSVASLVHKTAMTMAAEIAQLEREGELGTQIWQQDEDIHSQYLFLPWEVKQENNINDVPVYVTDMDLFDAILSLSHKDTTFSTPYSCSMPVAEKENSKFLDEPRIALIKRLLDVDKKLAAVHTRMAGRSSIQEVTFWRNYFFHCDNTRKEYLNRTFSDGGKRKRFLTPSGKTSSLSALSFGSEGELDNLDDASLVPVTETDDSSYVIYPAPSSVETFTTTTSLDDMVVVCHALEND